tara:strand:- start:40 stop:462 length:423 start_codon:yes stop_codon:yes gene_type:complete
MQYDLFGKLPYNKSVVLKTCRSCKKDKPENSFYITTHKKDGTPTRGYVCTDCKKEQADLRVKLRLTSGEPSELCQCCNISEAVLIDHCHETLEFRGWLCHNCNMGIGKLNDTISGVRKAIAYLERFEEQRDNTAIKPPHC